MTKINPSDVVKWVADDVDLARGDFREADLSNINLRCGRFIGADFTNADLGYATLHGADFTDAKLAGSNLYCTDLNSVIVRGADFTGACLQDSNIEATDFTGCTGIIDAGTDPRGYRFVGVKQADGTWQVKAGCRWFTLDEAREHWGDKSNDDALDRVEVIAAAT
jgi:uncharacterized protein YjbI with pentapeptide repeats